MTSIVVPRIERRRFIEWVRTTDLECIGYPRNRFCCPIANFLKFHGAKQVAVSKASVQFGLTRKRLPYWANIFVLKADGLPYGQPITKKAALTLLGEAP